VWGAARAERDSRRVAEAPAYLPPRPGEAVVIGSATRGLLRRAGVLCAGADALSWVPGDLSEVGRLGQVLPLGALGTPGEPGRGAQTLIAFRDIASFRLVGGVFGGERLTLHRRGGGVVGLRLRDPEAAVLLTAAFSTFAGAGDDDGDRRR
jgi:hypothetical protein